MIFITLGSQKFQFNRLLKAIDDIVESNLINEEVFAQIGYSDYEPKNYKFKNFLDREESSSVMEKADIVITHGGTGAIINAVKKRKKVIAVPRLAKYGEHVDDHQLQIVNQFSELKLISSCNNCEMLDSILKDIRNVEFNTYQSNTRNIIDSIEKFIEEEVKVEE